MSLRLLPWVLLVVSGVVYWVTAYPTITWWDSSSYSLAAATLGITSPPGSILLTLLGWPIAATVGSERTAHALNVTAGVLAAITVCLVYLNAVRLRRVSTGESTVSHTEAASIAVGTLVFAFSATLWEHAIKFTPYVLTAVFTGLILLVLLRWWRDADMPDAWRWIFALTLLLGIDFSIHRTNALIIPGAIAWIAIRSPGTLVQPRAVLAAFSGMALGLSAQFIVWFVAATTNSPMNFFQPDTWQRFWDYVSLASSGGNFLVNLWPRNAPFVGVQLRDFGEVMLANFVPLRGLGAIVGAVPLVLFVFGLITLFRQNRRLGTAFTVLVVLHALTTVVYFNIPQGYFRPFDRHYLPVFVVMSVVLSFGVHGILGGERNAVSAGGQRGLRSTLVIALGGMAAAVQLFANWGPHDASDRWFARDYASNSLEGLPPNAIYFTVGDNDTFPVMYLQAVEGVRPDVTIVNLSLANTEWFIEQMQKRDSTFPVAMTAAERARATRVSWADSVVYSPDSVHRMTPRPAYGDSWLPADVVLYDIVKTNNWMRPLAFSVTMGDGAAGWLAPAAKLQGLYWEVSPAPVSRLRDNLLERYSYRGYSDSTVVLEPESKIMGILYRGSLGTLIKEGTGSCARIVARLDSVLPPGRIGAAPQYCTGYTE